MVQLGFSPAQFITTCLICFSSLFSITSMLFTSTLPHQPSFHSFLISFSFFPMVEPLFFSLGVPASQITLFQFILGNVQRHLQGSPVPFFNRRLLNCFQQEISVVHDASEKSEVWKCTPLSGMYVLGGCPTCLQDRNSAKENLRRTRCTNLLHQISGFCTKNHEWYA